MGVPKSQTGGVPSPDRGTPVPSRGTPVLDGVPQSQAEGYLSTRWGHPSHRWGFVSQSDRVLPGRTGWVHPGQDWVGVALRQNWMGYPNGEYWIRYPSPWPEVYHQPGIDGVPSSWPGLDGVPSPKHHSEYLLCGRRYASCVNAGGLSHLAFALKMNENSVT